MRDGLEQIPNIGLFGIVMHRFSHRSKELFGKYHLNKSHAGILFTLHVNHALSQKELAKKLNVTQPSITACIQKMEKDGYISRRPDERDQRILRLELTQKGKDCIEDVQRVAKEMDGLLFQKMSVEEILLLRRLMLQIYENLCAEEPERKENDEKFI